MDESSSVNGYMPLAWLAALFATALGIHWQQQPLTSTRPDVKPWSPVRSMDDQPVEARLWQDPIAAIAADSSSERGVSVAQPRFPTRDIDPTTQTLKTDTPFKTIKVEVPLQEPEVEPPSQSAKIDEGQLHQMIVKRLTHHNAIGERFPQKDLVILIVPTNTRRYAEDAEERIRERFAVMSALEVAGMVPENAGGIGCLRVRGENFVVPPHDLQSAKVDIDVPFEWFHRKLHMSYSSLEDRLKSPKTFLGANRPSNVLVLWLDEDLLKTDPLFRIAKFVEILRGNPKFPITDTDPCGPLQRIYYLGPTTSTFLRRMVPWQSVAYSESISGNPMLLEWHCSDKRFERGIANALSEVRFQCWGAMLPDALLLNDKIGVRSDGSGEEGAYTGALMAKGATIRRMTQTDDALANAIYDELKLRGVNISDSNTNIVFISEWDTDWGRLVPLTFQAVARLRVGLPSYAGRGGRGGKWEGQFLLGGAFNELTCKNHQAPRFHSISYSRGLDGKIAGDLGAAQRRVEDGGKEGKGSKDKGDPRPEGSSQIDSIPRVSERLKEIGRHLQSQHHGEIKAIGILGVDVYDKLLILRASRKDFPSTPVFTTELDARYWHPSELRVASNLLVASAFGLQLQSDLQNLSPPFRSSRQTALFNAALASLLLRPDEEVAGGYSPFKLGKPRVFEIGINGPVDLSSKDDEGKGTSLHPIVRPPSYSHWTWLWRSVFAVIALSLACVMFRRLLPGYRSGDPKQFKHLADSYLLQCQDIVNGRTLARCLFGSKQAAATRNVVALRALPELRSALSKLVAPSTQMEAVANALPALDPHAPLHPALKTELALILNRYVKDGNPDQGEMKGRRQLVEDACREYVGAMGLTEGQACQIQCAEPRFEIFRLRILLTIWFLIAVVVSAAALTILIYRQHQYAPGGEPFFLTNGVSTWPTDILLLGTVLFSVFAICKGRLDLRENALSLSRRFCLPFPDCSSTPAPADPGLWGRLRWWFTVPAVNDCSTAEPKNMFGDVIWDDYLKRSHGLHSWRRVTRMGGLFLVWVVVVFLLFGWPERPTRGLLNTWVDGGLFVGALLSAAVLTFMLVDASGCMQHLIRSLKKWPVRWPLRTVGRVRRTEGLDDEEIPEWLSIQLIAVRTAAIDRLLYYPFVALAVIILAHSTFFDRYPISPSFVILAGTIILYSTLAMTSLTRAARKAKEEAIQSLEAMRLGNSSGEKLRVLDAAIQQLQKLNEGAFRKLTQRPIFSATTVLIACTLIKILDVTAR